MLPSTAHRVLHSTAHRVNQAIRERTEKEIVCTTVGGVETIRRRLSELDREWDIERVLELNAPILAAIGLVLGTTVDRRWHTLTGTVLGFLALHAVQGWCPPVPLLRRLGFRTQAEIAQERYALKALRGDFEQLPRDMSRPEEQARVALAATCR